MHLIKLIYYSLAQDLMPIKNKYRCWECALLPLFCKYFTAPEILPDIIIVTYYVTVNQLMPTKNFTRTFCGFLSFFVHWSKIITHSKVTVANL